MFSHLDPAGRTGLILSNVLPEKLLKLIVIKEMMYAVASDPWIL